MAGFAVAYSSSLAFSPIDCFFCSSILTRAWHRLRLLQRESGVACSVLGFARQRLLSRNDATAKTCQCARKTVHCDRTCPTYSTRNLVVFKSKTTAYPPRGGGGTQQMFMREGFSPEVQPLTLLYTIFHEKGTPLVYILLTNDTPFAHLV